MSRELEIKLEKALETIARLEALVEQLQLENKTLKQQCEWRFNGSNHQQLLKQLKYWIKSSSR